MKPARTTQFRARSPILAGWGLLCLAAWLAGLISVNGQDSENRFLFLVDVSERMERLAPQAQRAAARQFGMAFGTAYQIYDDCVDIFGQERQAGKSLGTDMKKGKLTLPFLLLLQHVGSESRQELGAMIFRNGQQEQHKQALPFRRGFHFHPPWLRECSVTTVLAARLQAVRASPQSGRDRWKARTRLSARSSAGLRKCPHGWPFPRPPNGRKVTRGLAIPR